MESEATDVVRRGPTSLPTVVVIPVVDDDNLGRFGPKKLDVEAVVMALVEVDR